MESLWFVINSAFHIQFAQEIAQYTSMLFLASSFPEERVCNAFMLDGKTTLTGLNMRVLVELFSTGSD